MKSKMKFILLVTAASLAISGNAYSAKKRSDTDYDSNYYESEGAILMKIRGMGIFAKSKPKKYPAITNNPATKEGNFITNGFGIQGSTSIFFTDNFGAELGLSAMLFKTSNSAIKAAQANYGTSTSDLKRKNVVGIPLELLAQYYVAPFGAIRPYVGAGYNYTYFYTQSRQFKVGTSHGPVFQAGVDFVLNDDSMINVDIKRYSMQPKVTYKSGWLGTRLNVPGKAKIDPVVVSVGMGWKF
jgi:outer membrane protein